MEDKIIIRSEASDAVEVSWFAPICNGDDRFLGSHDPKYRSNWTNTSNVLLAADRLGYNNILCPSSYQVGQDTMTFASAIAPLTKEINLLTAIRCGEIHPPMLGRAIATLDHILKGRLTINIISSNLPGFSESSEHRYQRSRMKTYQQNGGPLLYFGGYSPAGVDLCAEHCDVYLMWPETMSKLQSLMSTMSVKAAGYGRKVDFGLRIHVIVRETETEAQEAARQLMSHVDEAAGEEIRHRALDAKSLGVARQADMRNNSDNDGYAEDNLWTGIGRARSGCGAALVGTPDQSAETPNTPLGTGIRS